MYNKLIKNKKFSYNSFENKLYLVLQNKGFKYE